MGLQLDLTRQVKNVNWGGSVFIYAEELGNKLYYVKPSGQAGENPTIRTIALPESASTGGDGPLFGIIGSSYAMAGKSDDNPGTPTFLVCGLRTVPHDIDDGIGNMVRVFDRHAMIYLSNNGLKWKEARHQGEINNDYEHQTAVAVVALVWNPTDKLFYYDQHFYSNEPHNPNAGSSKDQIFKSSDGKSWTNSSSEETLSAADFKSKFPSFCVSNDCKDQLGQNVPDGVMATDPQGKNTAKPTSPPVINYGAGIGYTPGENTVRVKRTTKDESGDDVVEEYTASIPEIGGITCVAGHGSILMAGGSIDKNDSSSGGAVALSTDAGKTWKKIGTTVTGVVTMIAAPPSKSVA